MVIHLLAMIHQWPAIARQTQAATVTHLLAMIRQWPVNARQMQAATAWQLQSHHVQVNMDMFFGRRCPLLQTPL